MSQDHKPYHLEQTGQAQKKTDHNLVIKAKEKTYNYMKFALFFRPEMLNSSMVWPATKVLLRDDLLGGKCVCLPCHCRGLFGSHKASVSVLSGGCLGAETRQQCSPWRLQGSWLS